MWQGHASLGGPSLAQPAFHADKDSLPGSREGVMATAGHWDLAYVGVWQTLAYWS